MIISPTLSPLIPPHCTITFFGKNTPISTSKTFQRAFGTKDRVSIHQEHGTSTVVLRTSQLPPPKADGVATDSQTIFLIIRIADCQNFAVYAPKYHVIGLLHAGWRGLNTHIIPRFYETLQHTWGIQPQDTSVWAGPSLCTACAEFKNPRRELPTIDPQFFHDRHVDLRGAATNEFLNLGVSQKNIERHPDCTCCHPERYWTYRGGDREVVQQGHTNFLAAALKP